MSRSPTSVDYDDNDDYRENHDWKKRGGEDEVSIGESQRVSFSDDGVHDDDTDEGWSGITTTSTGMTTMRTVSLDVDGSGDDGVFQREESKANGEASSASPRKRCCVRLEKYSPFPMVIWLIMINEFTERFSFYSLRAILVLYLTDQLLVEHNVAISLYNASLFFIYITPLLGAWISDSFLGKFKTIACFSFIYCAGDAILSLTTKPPSFVGFLIGMALIALGAGGIKPCVASLGAEQIDGYDPDKPSNSNKRKNDNNNNNNLVSNDHIDINNSINVSREDYNNNDNNEFTSTTTTTDTASSSSSSPSSTSASTSTSSTLDAETQIQRYFSFFYTTINAGSLFSFIISPILRTKFGYFVAFGVPSVLLFIATITITLGKPYYKERIPASNHKSVVTTALLVMLYASWCSLKDLYALLSTPVRWCWHRCRKQQAHVRLMEEGVEAEGLESNKQPTIEVEMMNLDQHQRSRSTDEHRRSALEEPSSIQPERHGDSAPSPPSSTDSKGYDVPPLTPFWYRVLRSNSRFTEESIEHARAILRISNIYSYVPMFWALTDQQGSTWTLQAKQMDLHVFFGEIEPETLGVVNPLLLVFLVPVLNFGFFPFVEKYCRCFRSERGVVLTELRRFGLALILVLVSYVPALILQLVIDASEPNSISIWWQMPQLLGATIAESLIGPTLLEFAYTQSPPEIKSVTQSLWLLTVALGNAIISSVFVVFGFLGEIKIYYLFILLGTINIIGFISTARRYRYVSYVKND